MNIKKIIKKLYLIIILFWLSIFNYHSSQPVLNPRPIKTIISEWNKNYNKSSNYSNALEIVFTNHFFFNSNQSNLENINGLYIPKGYGYSSSFLFNYKYKIFNISAEPVINQYSNYKLLLPQKNQLFRNLNDVPLDKIKINKLNQIKNVGLKINFNNINIGYGNWNEWWGYGIHNSLSFSNNTIGMYNLFFDINGKLSNNLNYYFKYQVSDKILNNNNQKFYLTSYLFLLKTPLVEFGKSKIIQNGGYKDIMWNHSDAISVIITNKNLKYWDVINTYHLLLNFQASKLKLFIELGYPNQSFTRKQPEEVKNNSLASNIGFRKYGLFLNDNLLFGFEYTRLIQGHFYNLTPTPNWYQNFKYNYSGYNGRYWGSHSGTDSDDFLVYFGYNDKILSFIYGINYERHGVNFHFPPEVKLESRISVSYRFNKLTTYLIYEKEYFEHYAFLDNSKNIWTMTNEKNSIQRTNTLLLSFEYYFSTK